MSEAAIVPLDPHRRRRSPGRPRRRRAKPTGAPLIEAFGWWELVLNRRSRSAGTIRSYRDTVTLFASWLTEHGYPADVEGVDTEHVQEFLAAERERTSAGNAAKHFRNLRAFFRWLVKEQDRTSPTPVDSDDSPEVPDQERPPFTDAEIQALLAACKGTSFADVRDTAIIRTLIDIGPRVAGLAGVRYAPADAEINDLHLNNYRVRITLKGGDVYYAPLGKKAAESISRYIRRGRARHPHAAEPGLWLGKRGPMSKSGIQQMLNRRGKQAGIDDVHAHRFRRDSVTRFLDNGGSETDAMHIYGWKTTEMVRLYSKATAKKRALDAHARYSPGDRI